MGEGGYGGVEDAVQAVELMPSGRCSYCELLCRTGVWQRQCRTTRGRGTMMTFRQSTCRRRTGGKYRGCPGRVHAKQQRRKGLCLSASPSRLADSANHQPPTNTWADARRSSGRTTRLQEGGWDRGVGNALGDSPSRQPCLSSHSKFGLLSLWLLLRGWRKGQTPRAFAPPPHRAAPCRPPLQFPPRPSHHLRCMPSSCPASRRP